MAWIRTAASRVPAFQSVRQQGVKYGMRRSRFRNVAASCIVGLLLAGGGGDATADDPSSARTEPRPEKADVEELRRENARLKAELERLRKTKEAPAKESPAEPRGPATMRPRDIFGSGPPLPAEAHSGDELAPGEVRRLPGHRGGVYSVVVTPDGKHVLSCGADFSLRRWDMETGELLAAQPAARQPRGTDFIHQIALSPDGTLAALAAGQYRGVQRVVLWEPESWKPRAQWPGHDDAVKSVAISRDGLWLLTGGADGKAVLTDLSTLKPLHEIKADCPRVDAVAISPDGRQAVTGGFDSEDVETWNLKTGKLLGAHMVGPEVTELIQGFVVAMNLETTEEELMHTIFPHPTLSETMKEAVLDAYGKVLNA